MLRRVKDPGTDMDVDVGEWADLEFDHRFLDATDVDDLFYNPSPARCDQGAQEHSSSAEDQLMETSFEALPSAVVAIEPSLPEIDVVLDDGATLPGWDVPLSPEVSASDAIAAAPPQEPQQAVSRRVLGVRDGDVCSSASSKV